MSCLTSNTYELSKNSDEEIKEYFLNSFQLLSTKQKKIWQLLQWYSTHYRNCFPSHAKIAEQVGCCRDTVIESIKKFQEWGWLYSMKRCYRSSVYFIRDCLKKFDTRKDDTFKLDPTQNPTEIPTENPTLYNTYSKEKNVRLTKEVGNVQSLKEEKVEILSKAGEFSSKDLFLLTKHSWRSLRLAVEDYLTRQAASPVRNLAAWITSRCKVYDSK